MNDVDQYICFVIIYPCWRNKNDVKRRKLSGYPCAKLNHVTYGQVVQRKARSGVHLWPPTDDPHDVDEFWKLTVCWSLLSLKFILVITECDLLHNWIKRCWLLSVMHINRNYYRRCIYCSWENSSVCMYKLDMMNEENSRVKLSSGSCFVLWDCCRNNFCFCFGL